ncbi:DUF342 domain-containing protein [Cytobacillus depressus]|uniref:DUF342 domain-containing protein n=1 Tax=Cytobacillus depressus TaxID=1602942 RepID=A0A6L3V9Q8_9BACI|nr:FapA family protein [Cytobacillus depressus]KAB2337535.1 DUF342 domain-containing protein [Cytobacillus depressus]
MEKHFRIIITKDRLTAKLDLIAKIENSFSIEMQDVLQLLSNEKVSVGIKNDILLKICENPNSINYPTTIAEGIQPKDGMDAYLLNEIRSSKKESREKFNFRNVLQIPSVSTGQLLASIVPSTPGTDGMDVLGNKIPAKNGKPLKIKPSKNTILSGTSFYSTLEGQLSLTNHFISVNPIFEVNGDLDLKTGNIDFIGNVIINGNVPNGYKIRAGGDVRIFGLVEAANIIAGGNIIISGGVSGGNKGVLTAEGNIQATYLNQAIVNAKQDVIVESSILHSRVQAGSSIQCSKAIIIGGILIAHKEIHVKEVGNQLFTKTDMQMTIDLSLVEKEQALKIEKAELTDNISKLINIEKKLNEVAKKSGSLTPKQRITILKQRSTKQHIEKQLSLINEELWQLEEVKKEAEQLSIYIYESIYPNTSFQFGKYALKLQHKQSKARYFLQDGEIISKPI